MVFVFPKWFLMISCGVLLAFLNPSDKSTVPSRGYSGVASLSRPSLWPRERPLLLASVMTSCPPLLVYSGVLSLWARLWGRLRVGALPRVAAAWSSMDKRRSFCTCSLCAARASRNPSMRLAINLACARPASLFGAFLWLVFQF